MGLGPIGASRKALERANLTINEIDIVEINEAFASQSIACIKDLEIDINKVNLDVTNYFKTKRNKKSLELI